MRQKSEYEVFKQLVNVRAKWRGENEFCFIGDPLLVMWIELLIPPNYVQSRFNKRRDYHTN